MYGRRYATLLLSERYRTMFTSCEGVHASRLNWPTSDVCEIPGQSILDLSRMIGPHVALYYLFFRNAALANSKRSLWSRSNAFSKSYANCTKFFMCVTKPSALNR